MKLVHHNYGKARVRVMKVTRDGARHALKELDVSVRLEGDFDASYTNGDNALVVATDTMKNTINVLAREKLGAENEPFALLAAKHFVDTYRQVEAATVRVTERRWSRINGHNHSFVEKSPVTPFAEAKVSRKESVLQSGVSDLLILKTTASAFKGFPRDRFTTLPETDDRIFATQLCATWNYQGIPASYEKTNTAIVDSMLEVFANTFSPSVQTTLYQMGEAALRAAPEISRIHLAMPNKHCLLVNLAPFGLENKNELFVPTDEPHGQIEGTVSRE
jgi:urate oxidase